MEKYFYVDFTGSLRIIVPEGYETDKESIKKYFFEILNTYNATHDHQFQFCEVDHVEEDV